MQSILIVDDNAINRDIIREILSDEDYRIEDAADGVEALAKITSNPPDLVLLDILMRRLDGMQTLRAIKSQARTARVPVIMVSALGGEEHVANSLEEGAIDHIVRPFSDIVLRARVRAALNNSARAAPSVSARTAARKGKLLGVIGARGGVGASSLAISFAVQLLRRGEHSVGLAELRSWMGSLSVQLAIGSASDISVLLKAKSRTVRVEDVRRVLVKHPAGLQVLLAPQNEAGLSDITPPKAKAILTALTGAVEYSIVDLPSLPSAANKRAVLMCDQVVLVTEPDAACLGAAKVWLGRLSTWGVVPSALSVVVVNKTLGAPILSTAEISLDIGCRIAGTIKSDRDCVALAERINSLVNCGSNKARPLYVVAGAALHA